MPTAAIPAGKGEPTWEAERNVALMTEAIPAEFWRDLRAAELIQADAPTP